MAQPQSTGEWKRIGLERVKVSDVRPRAASTRLFPTLWKLTHRTSKITDDEAIYCLRTDYGLILVDGHHRLRAAILKRHKYIDARVAEG